MNAVNLIPSDTRRRRVSVSTSRPTLGVIAGLAAVLVAGVVYVAALNNVTTRQSELAQVSASAASWKAAADSYAPYVQEAQQRTEQLSDVKQLAAGRYQWSQLLSQIGGLTPANAALNTLQATSTPGTGASAVPVPAVQLSGCAASQSTVAETMDQLHRVDGVSTVTLGSSTDSASTGSSGSTSGSAGGSGSCPFPVQFQVSLVFSTPATAAAVASASVTGSSVPAATASAPSTTGAVQ
jgi:Tfp pilus assembly protein PilN